MQKSSYPHSRIDKLAAIGSSFIFHLNYEYRSQKVYLVDIRTTPCNHALVRLFISFIVLKYEIIIAKFSTMVVLYKNGSSPIQIG